MAITLVGVQTGTDDGNTTIVVTKPAGAASGDVAVAAIDCDSNDGVGLPSGFIELVNQDYYTDSEIAVGYKVLGGSEPSSYTFAKDDSEWGAAAIMVFRGVDNATPMDATASNNQGNNSTPVAASVTTSTAGAALVAVVGHENQEAIPFTAPSGMTQIVNQGAGTGTTGAALGAAWSIQSASGASGNKTFAATDADTWRCVLLALRQEGAEAEPTVIDVGQATETDAAQAVEPSQRYPVAVGRADEADAAQAVSWSRVTGIGLAGETDLARQVYRVRGYGLAGLVETDAAPAVAIRRAWLAARAREVDEAREVVAEKRRLLALATSTEIARSAYAVRGKVMGRATETNAATAITIGRAMGVGQADEVDTATKVAINAKPVGLARENDQCLPVLAVKLYSVGRLDETDATTAVEFVRKRFAGRVVEQDQALPLYIIGGLLETDYYLVWRRRRRL